MTTVIRNTGLFLAISVLVFSALFVTAPRAEAACSPQGLISSQGKCGKSIKDIDAYETKLSALLSYIEQLQDLLDRLRELRDAKDDGNEDDDFEVVTRSAVDVDEDRATLRGEVEFGESETADVWFEYGTDSDDLDEETDKDELSDDEDEVFEFELEELEADTRYYYRAVAESDDGDIDRGALRNFTTEEDEESDDEEPDADTDEAEDVTDDSAELYGSVDMHDFENGLVFFAYGEDETQVSDLAEDYDEFDDVNEDGDDLQVVEVDNDLDNEDDYTLEVENLDPDRNHFFTMCVEFENSDEDPEIVCGSTKSFTTEEAEA